MHIYVYTIKLLIADQSPSLQTTVKTLTWNDILLILLSQKKIEKIMGHFKKWNAHSNEYLVFGNIALDNVHFN
jgi:hypothetical protein